MELFCTADVIVLLGGTTNMVGLYWLTCRGGDVNPELVVEMKFATVASMIVAKV